jgi:hypothetical protein
VRHVYPNAATFSTGFYTAVCRAALLRLLALDGHDRPAPAAQGPQWAAAEQAKIAPAAVLHMPHVIPREKVHEFAGDIRDVDCADLIDQDLGIAPGDEDIRPVDGRLGACRGGDDGQG